MNDVTAATEVHRLPVATLADGTDVGICLHEIRGRLGDGPTVGVCAAIHGNEPTGAQIAFEVAQRFAPGAFRGRLLLLPVANPPSFQANRRHSPIDDLNLNRLFPGTSDGWISERLAATITEHLLERVDVFIDLHSGGDRPTVDYVYIHNAEELSRGFGSRILYRANPTKVGTMFSGTSVAVTTAREVPSVVVELGGGGIDQRVYIERGVRGVTNILRLVGVLNDPPDSPPEQVVADSIVTVRPGAGGWLETVAPPLGDAIGADAPLGRIVSPYSFEVLEELRNPADDGVMVLSHLTRNLVQPGDYGYMIATGITA